MTKPTKSKPSESCSTCKFSSIIFIGVGTCYKNGEGITSNDWCSAYKRKNKTISRFDQPTK